MKRVIRFVAVFAIGFLFCNLFLYYTKINTSKVNDNDFLFGFIGLLLGFSLVILPFVVTLAEKLKDRAEEKYHADGIRKTRLQELIQGLFQEVKDDIMFVFISLIIIGIIYLFQDVKTPYIDVGSFNEMLNKKLVIKSIRMELFLLNLYAIYDLIAVSFKLSDSTGIFKTLEGKISR